MNKKIISIAVIMALPLMANADPTPVPSNGTAVVASQPAPYQTVGITPATDGAHIASTAYVKGAYNDAIAAVNKVSEVLDETKQNALVTESGEEFYSTVFSAYSSAGMTSDFVDTILNSDFASVSDFQTDLNIGELGESLTSVGGAVAATLVGVGKVKDYVDDKRVTARDTWNSNHEVKVELDVAD